MNSASKYSHFIHGKFVTQPDSGYRLVARSNDLTNEEYLTTMAKTYRFWGSRQPEKNVKAVGIFFEEGNQNIVLVKVKTAVDESEREVISGNRGFNQHHYIIIPIDSVTKQLHGRTFQLLSWINNQPIPLFSEFKADLPSPEIPHLNEPLPTKLNKEEANKINRCLNDTNTEGQQLLLLALAALSNDKRLLLTGAVDNNVDFVENLLLLLPASVRSKVSIAVGTLDEEHGDWAKLLIKTNNPSGGKPADNLIRLNFGSRKFEGQFDKDTTFKSDYATLLQAIVHISEEDVIPRLLQKLDSLDDNNLTLENPAPVNIVVGLIKEFPQVFQQVWKSFSTTKQIEFLQELKNNLDLAENLLLNEKLLELLPDQAEDNKIVPEPIVLCKSVVADKSQKDFQGAWNLATNLVTNKIFQNDIAARFNLLDTPLASKITTVEDLYNSFNRELALLLVNFDGKKFESSNLYRQLQSKNQEAAQLLNTLLVNRNAVLKYLPRLANLMGMKEPEQDKFYKAVLDTWSPSYEHARELLAALIKQFQESSRQFNRNTLVKTCTWFESKKPELSKIFIALGEPNITWDIWKKLADALYQEQQKSADFLDKIVGTIFAFEVSATWLPVIAEHDNLRIQFSQASLAWQQLRSQPEYFDQLPDSQPEYATTLTRCLRDSKRLDLLNSKLLHYLCEQWIERKCIDDDLKIVITQEHVIQRFTTHDWLKLQCVCWIPDINLKMPLGRPDLEASEKKDLLNQAITIVNKFYTQPGQTRRLLEDCKAWQLDLTQLKEILKKVADKARDFDLVLEYISTNLEAIDPSEDIPLLFAQLNRLSPASAGLAALERFKQNLPLTEILLNHGLYEQRCLLNNTGLLPRLRILCRSVVECKSQKNYLEAWRFATSLATKKIFQDDMGESFMLLDSALAGEIKPEELHNFFNYKFAPLIVYLEPAGIRDSQLYQNLLLKHPEVAQLVNTLLIQKNSVLKYLPQLANLTGMKEREQDKFYKVVLDKWSPSDEDARELLAALIKQSHGMDSKNSNGNALVETYAWFEEKKSELSSIFIALWQSPVTWDTWDKLARLLYEEQQDSAAFLDKIVGTEFPINVLKTWLPAIAKDDNVRREFCQNSLAWQQLRSQPEYFDQLPDSQPEYATTLTRCLRDSESLDLLNSKLLHYLFEQWIEHKFMDHDLKNMITQEHITQRFTTHDWLKLQCVCWIPEIDLEMPLDRPDLGVSEKRDLLNQAIKIANNLYTQLPQLRLLIQDCKAWQLDLTQLKEILKSATALVES